MLPVETGGCDLEHENLRSSFSINWVSAPGLLSSLCISSAEESLFAGGYSGWIVVLNTFFYFQVGGLSLREEYVKAAYFSFLTPVCSSVCSGFFRHIIGSFGMLGSSALCLFCELFYSTNSALLFPLF